MATNPAIALPPVQKMEPSALKIRDTYAIKPNAPFFQREFGYYSLEAWKEQGMPQDISHEQLFGMDKPGMTNLGNLGWCEAAFSPEFETKVLEDRGEHEVVQDFAGRKVLYFKNRRSGFMPEYLDHPVKDRRSWEENCKWRLNPESAGRYLNFDKEVAKTVADAERGLMVTQGIIGGYMFLRSLIGPVDLLYKVCEDPELIHDCMKTWLTLADAVTARYQQHFTYDEIFFGEDICYNNGSLISPEMIKEFLFPYYQQLITNIKSRQLDKTRHLYFQVDTDGHAEAVIGLYRAIGMDVMSPFEVASGCDVVAIGKKFPDLVMTGGIDKRILATTKDAIDKHVDAIFPVMFKRGGYLPTCDHGVPAEVSYENYLHFRKRCREYA